MAPIAVILKEALESLRRRPSRSSERTAPASLRGLVGFPASKRLAQTLVEARQQLPSRSSTSLPSSKPTPSIWAQKRACQRSATRANRLGSRSRTSRQSARASASVRDLRSAAAAQAAGRFRRSSARRKIAYGWPSLVREHMFADGRRLRESHYAVCSRPSSPAADAVPNSRAAQPGQKNTTSSSPSSSRSTR